MDRDQENAMNILLSSRITADVTDLLADTRLQTIPQLGILTMEFQADVAETANNATVTIQLPNGDTPFQDVMIPAHSDGKAGSIDNRCELMMSYDIQQGGHPVISIDVTGTVIVAYRINYRPA